MERRFFLKATASSAALVMVMGGAARAQWKPDRPINVIVPFEAGGATDSFARTLAAVSDEALPVPMIIVNKPGAAGMSGATEAARARPDGSTILLTSAGSFLLTSMLLKAEVSPLEDYRIIAQVGNNESAIMVSAESPYHTLADLVDDLKKRPGELRWAHAGRGGFHHVGCQLFLNTHGLKAQDVPFKGGSASRAAVLGRQVDFGMIGVQQAAGFESQLRILALNAGQRHEIMSDVPTFSEQGFETTEISSPMVVFAPKAIDEEVARGLEAAVRKMTESSRFATLMAEHGNVPAFLSSAQIEQKLRRMEESAGALIAEMRASK